MKLAESYPFYLANRPEAPNQDLAVTDKYTGEVATGVALASRDDIDRAIAKAEEAAAPMRRMKAYQRREILDHCVKRFTERAEELAQTLCIEAGKPIADSRGEVTRLIETFRIASGESERIAGEVMPLDNAARSADYVGFWKRVPIGPCSFISPFNFPLNLTAHKVAPALACGCPFILKPASLTPLGAIIIAEVLAETDLPEGAFSVLPCPRDGADLFVEDDRLKLLSFTGSPSVGWEMKARAGKKPVVLELGGNAACVIDEDADIADALERVIFGGYYQSGQSCVSVQRVMIHDAVYDDFRERMITAVKGLVAGDPKDEKTFIGPMISVKEAERLKGWIDDAVSAGATLLAGGELDGAMLEATLLEDVPCSAEVYAEEAFGPVVVLERFSDFYDALTSVNDSRFGLQVGIFTRDIYKVMNAWDGLDVGGVIVGDVPSWRVDNMPYGGVKDSGLGREGVKFAIEDMTEVRLLALRRRGLQKAFPDKGYMWG